MRNLQKSALFIQDKTSKKDFYCIKESKDTRRNFLPALNDIVFLPFSSSMNGFIYNKSQSYQVIEVRCDYINDVLYIFLKRI